MPEQTSDEHLPQEIVRKWASVMENALDMIKVEFQRSTWVEDGQSIMLIGFCDGSSIAYCSVIYLRWQTSSRGVSNLVQAKTRLAQKTGTTIPRMELQAFLQCLRVLKLVIKTSHLSLHHMRIVGDSECTVAALRKQDNALRPYSQNRVEEAQEIMHDIENVAAREVEVRLTHTRVAGTAADITSVTRQQGLSYLSDKN